jgi:hypothetical protein
LFPKPSPNYYFLFFNVRVSSGLGLYENKPAVCRLGDNLGIGICKDIFFRIFTFLKFQTQ